MVEVFTAVTCACLPTLRPVVQYIFSSLHSLISSTIRSYSSGLGRSAGESEFQDTYILAPKSTTGVFQRLPDPQAASVSPPKPAEAGLGRFKAIKREVDAERGITFDGRDLPRL